MSMQAVTYNCKQCVTSSPVVMQLCPYLRLTRQVLVLQAFDSLELTEEKMHAITDKIPQKPVTLVEGTSYMVIILGAFAVSSSLLQQQW